MEQAKDQMGRMRLVQGDLTLQPVDAVVNAANPSLLGGGGVDGAIHRAAGPELRAACARLSGCATGQAKITAGFRLFARYVIHTVGPVWQGGGQNESLLLARCYINSLEIALREQFHTMAFPAISTGVYGYPFDDAARIAWDTTAAFLAVHPYPKRVYFVLYTAEDYQRFSELI